MPILVEDDGGTCVAQFLVVGDHVKCLFGNAVVEFTAGVVELVDVGCQLEGMFVFLGKKESHRVGSLVDTPCGVDARTDEEHQVADGELAGEGIVFFSVHPIGVFLTTIDVGVLEDGLDARARLFVELFQSIVGQHTVFAGDGHDVGSNADSQQVEQLIDLVDRQFESHRESGDELEAHAATREFLVGIGAVGTLGVEHSHGSGNLVTCTMVVADGDCP